MKTLNIGLVGYGFMGRTHSNAFLQAPRFFDLPYKPVLKAVAARNEELVAELESTREALSQAASGRRPTQGQTSRVPAVPQPSTGQSIVVWRRGR